MCEEDIFDSTPFRSVEELAESFRQELETIYLCSNRRINKSSTMFRIQLVYKYLEDNGIDDIENLDYGEKEFVLKNIDRILKGNIIKIG